MNETSKAIVSRSTDIEAYNSTVKRLLEICELSLQHAFDRDDKMDIIIAQAQLIGVLKLK